MRISIAILIFAAACGSDSKKKPNVDSGNQIDSAKQIDAAVQLDTNEVLPDAPIDTGTSSNCLVASSLATVTPINPLAQADDLAAPTAEQYFAQVNNDTLPDGIGFQFYIGYGAWLNDATIVPKTAISLTGAESGFDTCGACVLVFADIDQTNGPAAYYMPTAGTLDVTSTTTNLTGTLTNVTLQHVDIDPDSLATTPNADGCTTTITSMQFDTTIAMAFAKTKLLHKNHK
jgi:hypothetical protein